MKIKNWIACVQGQGKWKEVVEKAKTFNLGCSAPGRRRRRRRRRRRKEEEEEDIGHTVKVVHFVTKPSIHMRQ
jgi:hypothetical protein